MMQEVKIYRNDRSPIVEDIRRCIEIARENDCVVRLEWFIKWSGKYCIQVDSRSNAEDVYIHEVPKAYGI